MKPIYLSCLSLATLLASATPSRGQSPLDRIEPYANIVDRYYELEPSDYAFGVGLGQVDSVTSVQTNLPDIVNRYRLGFTADSVVLDFTFPNQGGQPQREVYRIPLAAIATGSDAVVYRNIIELPNFDFTSTERSRRFFDQGRLDSIRTDVPAAENVYSGTRILRRTYVADRDLEVTVERLEGDGLVFLSRDSTVTRYDAQRRVAGGAYFEFDENTRTYEPTTVYNYLYGGAAGRRIRLTFPPAPETLELQFAEGTELTAIETVETGGGASGSILSRLDDDSNPRVRKYLRPVLARGALFEDTWYYRSDIVSTRELPLIVGSVTGANPIRNGGELRLNGFAEEAQLTVVDLSGRVVLSRGVRVADVLVWPALAPGPYYLVVSAPGFASRAWPWVAF